MTPGSASGEPVEQVAGDTRPRTAVAEWPCRAGHGGARGGIGKETGDRTDDPRGVGPDEPEIATGNAFGALGLVTQDKQRDAERGGLFLDPARIAEDEVGGAHRGDHRTVVARLDQADRALTAEQQMHRLGDTRIGVKHAVDPYVATAREGDQRPRDRGQPDAPILTAMAGHQQQRWPPPIARGEGWQGCHGGEQSIDTAVAGDTVALIERKPGITRSLFTRYWRDVHGVMAARIPGFETCNSFVMVEGGRPTHLALRGFDAMRTIEEAGAMNQLDDAVVRAVYGTQARRG